MKHLSFLSQCITNPRNVGAVLPSSKFLAEKMMENINFEKLNILLNMGQVRVYSLRNYLKNEIRIPLLY